MLKHQKLDITERIVGRLKDTGVDLYLDNQLIGHVELPNGFQVELQPNYEQEATRVFQHFMAPDDAEPRYTDCDEGGWC
ncbi:hypothetical protein Q73_12275 [Bacillus coahuilensis m2-6]|uniref:DUF2553 domain-containing protein n=2 Tax=Bacillus coahuilensis TaxID=408580 RepID=A0A147K5Y0_9BACI|nr:YusG family protein [Bacillus coahuilensis]KUP05262.1 hypothetical protein Q75_12870 [Bacillus coahuilensis p1.1.43]KUP05727.1 hypothetical protein Q73_12275 [Bacillus coahuilensis m2-6]